MNARRQPVAGANQPAAQSPGHGELNSSSSSPSPRDHSQQAGKKTEMQNRS